MATPKARSRASSTRYGRPSRRRLRRLLRTRAGGCSTERDIEKGPIGLRVVGVGDDEGAVVDRGDVHRAVADLGRGVGGLRKRQPVEPAPQFGAVTVVEPALGLSVNDPTAFDRPSNRSRTARTIL